MVWDNDRDAIAVLGGCELTGKTRERAEVACGLLQRIFRNRLDARADTTQSLLDRAQGI
jgi:hypothetical protein